MEHLETVMVRLSWYLIGTSLIIGFHSFTSMEAGNLWHVHELTFNNIFNRWLLLGLYKYVDGVFCLSPCARWWFTFIDTHRYQIIRYGTVYIPIAMSIADFLILKLAKLRVGHLLWTIGERHSDFF
jgi:hypothetical protein